MKKLIVNTDCRYYRGDMPCGPHKAHGVHCEGCSHYEAASYRILIMKLGAIGDVIRTTPIIRKLKAIHPEAHITWLTDTPAVVPSAVDRVMTFNIRDIVVLGETKFDLLLSLDKDREVCALANSINAGEKRGFKLENGYCHPIGKEAEHKWLTGLFDDISRENRKSYPEEIFELCGYRYKKEPYILEVNSEKIWNLDRKNGIIGLNTGCGKRWQTRLWPEVHWINLAELLQKADFVPVFLGGEQEDGYNRRLAEKTGSTYLGHFPLNDFISLVNQCDLIVTAVTMALHIALGLKKKVVLFNNIFNPCEFELYGLGEILEPPKDCKGCYRNQCEDECMALIMPEMVKESIDRLIFRSIP